MSEAGSSQSRVEGRESGARSGTGIGRGFLTESAEARRTRRGAESCCFRGARSPESGAGRTNRVCDHKDFRVFEKNRTLRKTKGCGTHTLAAPIARALRQPDQLPRAAPVGP